VAGSRRQRRVLRREEIRAGIERLKNGLRDYLVQTTHPATIQLDGDTAFGRAYVLSFERFRDGGSHPNYSVYHASYPVVGCLSSAGRVRAEVCERSR
jgi:hypothetical protein